MTSKLTRERVFALIAEHSYDSALVDALEHLLAAMDSEPVAYIFKHPAGRLFWALTDESNKGQSDVMPVYAEPQPAPAFPDFDNVLESLDYEVRCNAWESEHVMQACQTTYDACRAAMLQELQKSAGAEATCRSNKNVQVLHTKSPAQSDCCPAQNHVSPEQNGDTPAQSQGWIPVSERMPEDSGRYWCYVEEQNDLGKSHYQWNCSWNGDRWWVESEGGGIVTYWMPLPAAPQEVNRE